EGQARAVVVLGVDLGLLAVDDGQLGQGVAVEGGVGGGGAGGAVLARLGVGQVDAVAGGEVRRQGHVQQAALAARGDRRHALDRLGDAAVGADPAPVAAALGDQEAAVRQGRN